MIFVTVGHHNQPFDHLLRWVKAVAEGGLPVPVVVQRGCSRLELRGCKVHDYLPLDDYERLMDAATVVVTQAGIGAVLDAVKRGHRPIVVPRLRRHGEAIDDHQAVFADALGTPGIAHVAQDEPTFRAALATAMAEGRTSKWNYSNMKIQTILRAFIREVEPA